MAVPADLTNKALWLRAKDLGAGGSTVTTWADQSGKAHDATAAAGTLTVAAASTPSGGKSVDFAAGGFSLPDTLRLKPAWATSAFGTLVATRLFDGNNTTEWNALNGTMPQSVTYRTAGAQTVTAYTLTGSNSVTKSPTAWTFYGSTDGDTWTVLDSQSGITPWTARESKVFAFSNSTAYSWYRFTFTAKGAGAEVALSEIRHNAATVTLAAESEAELWLVVKSDGASTAESWDFSGGGTSHYPYTSLDVYEDFGSNNRRNFTPTVAVTSWRLYRVRAEGSNWTVYLDNESQLTNGANTRIWTPTMRLGVAFSGNIAEALVVSRPLTEAEAADLITYFNTEHGLAVPGGSTPGALEGTVAATSSVEGAISANLALSGTVAAVSGVEGAFESSGTVHPFTGQVDAVSGVEGTLAARVALAGQVDAVSVVQGSLNGDVPPTPMALSLTARASLTLAEPLSATLMSFDLTAKATLNVVMTRPSTIDPVTGLPQYRLVAVAADGTRLGELPNAEIGDIVEELGLDGTSVDFALPKYDATNRYVLPERGDAPAEVQVWRGPNLETWQKVDGARPTAATIEYDCSGLGSYLNDRLIGRIPKTDWLVNGDFTGGFAGWTFGYDAGSIPASQPKRSIVDVDFFGTKAKALKLSGADKITTTKRTLETAAVFVPNEATFLPGGAALVTSEAEQIPDGTTSILIEGHTAYNWLDGDYGDGLALSLARANAAKPYVQAVHPDATITTVGKGRFEPLNDNSTYEEQAVNRRVEFHYSTTVTADADSAQWAKGSLTVGATYTNPKSTKRALPVTFFGWALLTNFLSESKTGYGVHVSIAKASAPTVIIAEESSQLDASTPTDDWVRHEASVDIPADGIAYIVSVKFYAPGGDVLWTHGGVYPEEALHYPAGTDRALIVKGLVEHAQDPAMGKLGDTPILIGTRTPLTGTLTKATYPFHERRKVLDAVNEHAAVAHGVDLRLGHSDTERWVETHYPRLGSITNVTLELGVNVIAYESPIDVASSGTRWIAQALESSGADREEGIYTDTSGLGGVLVERLAYAEPGTPVTELYGAAEKSGKRYGHPVSDLTVTIGKIGAPDPALTSWMLDHVKVGDVVTVDIQDGPIVHAGPHRVVRKVLTPESDTLRYSLIPEV